LKPPVLVSGKINETSESNAESNTKPNLVGDPVGDIEGVIEGILDGVLEGATDGVKQLGMAQLANKTASIVLAFFDG
jgi:hypothetical protein